jgi:hypothetical protein
MLGAAHMTMSSHFDMDEIFQQLVTTKGNHGKTKVSREPSIFDKPVMLKFLGISGSSLRDERAAAEDVRLCLQILYGGRRWGQASPLAAV